MLFLISLWVAMFILVVNRCIRTGRGLYLDTAQVMTLSNLHTMLIDEMMSFHLVNTLITTEQHRVVPRYLWGRKDRLVSTVCVNLVNF